MARHREDGLVIDTCDTLTFESIGGGVISLCGEIRCVGDISIDVEKYLAIVDGEGHATRVQTFKFTYDVHINKIGNIFRYCSAHPDHNKQTHVHRYDVFGTGEEDAKGFRFLNDEEWPNLSQVIIEAAGFYYDHVEELDALRARFK